MNLYKHEDSVITRYRFEVASLVFYLAYNGDIFYSEKARPKKEGWKEVRWNS